MRNLIRRHQLVVFFSLALILGWLPWYTGRGGFLYAAPLISAVLVAVAASGWQGILEILRRISRWKTSFWWYLLVLFSPALLYLLAVGIHALAGGGIPGFPLFRENQGMLGLQFLMFLLPWSSSAFLEEVGLRGYALEELQERLGPLSGTLILGVFFGGMLLPEFLREGSVQAAMGGMGFFPWFVLQEIGWSCLMTFVYNRTGRSALLAGYLLHAAFNFWAMVLLTETVPGAQPEAFDQRLFVVSSIVVTAAALVLIIVTKGRLGYSEKTAVKL